YFFYCFILFYCFFFFSSRRRHTRFSRDWSSDVCSSDLQAGDFPHISHPFQHIRSFGKSVRYQRFCRRPYLEHADMRTIPPIKAGLTTLLSVYVYSFSSRFGSCFFFFLRLLRTPKRVAFPLT